MRATFAMSLIAACAAFAAGQPATPAPANGDGWIDLLKAGKDTPWKKVDPGWLTGTGAKLDPEKNTRLKIVDKTENGPVWVNSEKGQLPDLVTKQSFGDCEVHLEFLIAKNSNSGIKFHAVYEIQILDSFGKKKLSGDDCGGIYPRAEASPSYHHIDEGIAPKVNAAKPAGEWQTLDVIWHSPRLNAKGEKTANAKVVKATLNGQVVHENQELKTPTGNNWNKKETASGPFMLQADHGPVAFRNVRIKPSKE